MAYKPVALDHVNIFVRNAERSHKWYTDVFGLHTQDTMTFPGTGKLRAAFLSCDRDHAHDIALFEVGEDAPGPQKKGVGLNHVAAPSSLAMPIATSVYAREPTVSLGTIQNTTVPVLPAAV